MKCRKQMHENVQCFYDRGDLEVCDVVRDLAQGYLFGKPASAQAVSSETFRPGRKAG